MINWLNTYSNNYTLTAHSNNVVDDLVKQQIGLGCVRSGISRIAFQEGGGGCISGDLGVRNTSQAINVLYLEPILTTQELTNQTCYILNMERKKFKFS